MIFNDLHMFNIMVRPDDSVVLIDFEAASYLSEGRRVTVGNPEFVAPRDRTLDRSKAAHIAAVIAELFGAPAAFLDEAVREIVGTAPASGAKQGLDWGTTGRSDIPVLARSVAASATPGRTDRLFPGDIEQFAVPGGGLGIAHGAAGVLYALTEAADLRIPEFEEWLRDGVSTAHLIGAIAYIGGSLRSVLYTLSQGLGAGMVRLTVTLERVIEAGSGAADNIEVGVESGFEGGAEIEAGLRELRGVRFGYSASAEPVIDDLSIDIAPGEHLAIVGPSGIGKSSLAGLLAGMLEPTAGAVLLDGVPVTQYPHCVRVLIPQEAYVFADTLAANICYLRASAALDASVDAAVAAVGLGPLVTRLGGCEAVLNPARLSAGGRQLIALARAYLSPAPIVILDEATCYLDPAAESRAEAAFAERGGTLIVIAHRISSALRAQRVLFLDGTQAQSGEHDTLLVGSPMYRDLVGYWNAASAPQAPAARR